MTQKLPPKLNAATHWMTSRQPLIPGESREALQAHLEHWNKLYPGVETDELLNDFVREAAFEQWLLFPYQRQYDATVADLYKTEIDDWPPEHHRIFQLRERYLNAAQRRFNRHRSDIFQYQSNLRSQAREDRAANHYAVAQKAQEATEKEAEKATTKETGPHINNNLVRQTVDVFQENGKTKTFFTPTNDHLLDHIAKFRYETTLVERRIRFEEHFVPPEYEAFTERAAALKSLPYEARIHLPITFRSLRIAVEREKEFGGHLRDWPDLRAQDEEIIQLHLQEERGE